jgi:hypothetical protein
MNVGIVTMIKNWVLEATFFHVRVPGASVSFARL